MPIASSTLPAASRPAANAGTTTAAPTTPPAMPTSRSSPSTCIRTRKTTRTTSFPGRPRHQRAGHRPCLSPRSGRELERWPGRLELQRRASFANVSTTYHLHADWAHLGFERYREGVAILSRFPSSHGRSLRLHRRDVYSIHARKAVLAQVDVPHFGLVNVFSTHLSWWRMASRAVRRPRRLGQRRPQRRHRRHPHLRRFQRQGRRRRLRPHQSTPPTTKTSFSSRLTASFSTGFSAAKRIGRIACATTGASTTSGPGAAAASNPLLPAALSRSRLRPCLRP